MITCTCDDFNCVGNEWFGLFSINDQKVEADGRVTISLSGETIRINTEIMEEDKYSDYGYAQNEMILTQESMEQGFIIEQEIEVREDRGKGAGNAAIWEIAYTFLP